MSSIFELFNLTLGLVSYSAAKEFFTSDERLQEAKHKVTNNVEEYSRSMGYLGTQIGAELLKHDKNDNRRSILKWLSDFKHWERHEFLKGNRAPNTGTWVLGLPEFEKWEGNDSSHLLVCHGIGTCPCELC